MADIYKGIAAGFVATVVVSALVLVNAMLGVLPELSVVAMLATMIGAAEVPAVAWVLHFVIGAGVWGAVFAWLEPRVPGDSHVRRGILFGVLAWLVLMMVLLPLADGGFFGLRIHYLAPFVTLLAHVVYGGVLGWVYGKLAPTRDPFAPHDHRTVA